MATVYKVSTIAVDGKVHVKWASSEGAARKAKKELADEHGLRPLKDVGYDQVDVPTSKGGIIDWLNENHTVERIILSNRRDQGRPSGASTAPPTGSETAGSSGGDTEAGSGMA